MKYNKWTIGIILGIVAIIIIADFALVFKFGQEGTISNHIIELSHQYIIIPFSMGVVCGHLWWPLGKKK